MSKISKSNQPNFCTAKHASSLFELTLHHQLLVLSCTAVICQLTFSSSETHRCEPELNKTKLIDHVQRTVGIVLTFGSRPLHSHVVSYFFVSCYYATNSLIPKPFCMHACLLALPYADSCRNKGSRSLCTWPRAKPCMICYPTPSLHFRTKLKMSHAVSWRTTKLPPYFPEMVVILKHNATTWYSHC